MGRPGSREDTQLLPARWRPASGGRATTTRVAMLVSLGLLLLTLLTLPAPGAAMSRQVQPSPSAVPTDSVWFVTNRAFADGGWRDAAGPLIHGLRTFEVTPRDTTDRRDTRRLRRRLLDDHTMGPADWLARVGRHAMATPATDGAILVYVHGYASSLEEATGEVAEMRRRAGYEGPVVLFAWPSLPLGLTWPARGRLLTNAYWRDSAVAAASVPAFAEALATLVRTVGAGRVVLAAHSMGNQLVAAALSDPWLREQLVATPLRALAFVSPDLDVTYFRDVVAPSAAPLAQRRLLYAARNDRMLWLSSIVHGRPRAGRLSDDMPPWPAGLEVIDMTAGRSAGTGFPSLLGTNHAFRRERTALSDLFGLVTRGAPAECRAALGGFTRAEDGLWVATAGDQSEAVAPYTSCAPEGPPRPAATSDSAGLRPGMSGR